MKGWIWSTVAYIATTLVIGHPAIFGPDGGLFGGGEQPDWTGTAWAFWWTQHALSSGANPFVASANFFPIGQSPTAWYNLLDAFLAAPLVHVFGLVHGYNAFVFFILSSTGLAAHLLSRTLGFGHLASLVSGVFWMTSPWLLSEITHGRLSQALMVFFLLALTGAVRSCEKQASKRAAIGTGIALAACAFGYWFYGLFLAAGLSIYWIHRFRALRNQHGLPTSSLLAPATITLATAGLLCIGPILSLVANFSEQPGVRRAMERWVDQGELGNDSFGLNMAIMHGNWVLWPWANLSDDPIPIAFPGIAWIFLFGLYAYTWRRRQKGLETIEDTFAYRPWLAIGLLGYILSLGPYLKISNTEALPIPLPFLALHHWMPFFERLWWPDRAGILAIAAFGVILAASAHRLTQTNRVWGSTLSALLLLGMLLETSIVDRAHPVPIRTPRTADPALYQDIDGPILTIPLLGASDEARHLLWFQTIHQQPVTAGLGDHIRGHAPPAYTEWVEGNPLLSHLSRLSQGETSSTIVQPEDVRDLLDRGLEWIVIDHAVFPRGHDGEWGREFRHICHLLWDRRPDIMAARGAAWRIRPITEAVFLPRAGPLDIPNDGSYSDGPNQ